MLELVRYQKRDLQKAAGAEYDVLSSAQMIQSEKKQTWRTWEIYRVH